MTNASTEELERCVVQLGAMLRRIEDDYAKHAVTPASFPKSKRMLPFDVYVTKVRNEIAEFFETEKTPDLVKYAQELDDIQEDCRIDIFVVQLYAYRRLQCNHGRTNRTLEQYCDDLYDEEIMRGIWNSPDEYRTWYLHMLSRPMSEHCLRWRNTEIATSGMAL